MGSCWHSNFIESASIKKQYWLMVELNNGEGSLLVNKECSQSSEEKYRVTAVGVVGPVCYLIVLYMYCTCVQSCWLHYVQMLRCMYTCTHFTCAAVFHLLQICHGDYRGATKSYVHMIQLITIKWWITGYRAYLQSNTNLYSYPYERM